MIGLNSGTKRSRKEDREKILYFVNLSANGERREQSDR